MGLGKSARKTKQLSLASMFDLPGKQKENARNSAPNNTINGATDEKNQRQTNNTNNKQNDVAPRKTVTPVPQPCKPDDKKRNHSDVSNLSEDRTESAKKKVADGCDSDADPSVASAKSNGTANSVPNKDATMTDVSPLGATKSDVGASVETSSFVLKNEIIASVRSMKGMDFIGMSSEHLEVNVQDNGTNRPDLLVRIVYADAGKSILSRRLAFLIAPAYFNEFAGEWGQIFHRGKGKQLEFVDRVEKIMINEDTEEIGCRWIGVASIFEDWRNGGQ